MYAVSLYAVSVEYVAVSSAVRDTTSAGSSDAFFKHHISETGTFIHCHSLEQTLPPARFRWCLNHGSGAFGVSALLTVRRRTKLAVHDRRLMCLSIRSFE